MTEITDTDDYEQKFLEKYIKTQAESRIKELENQMSQTLNTKKRNELNQRIKNILDDLQINLRNLKQKSNADQIDLLRKSEKLEENLNNDFFEYSGLKIPINIWNYLFDYQKEGIKWIIDLYTQKRGGILADEMGLGKTIQAATFIISTVLTRRDAKFLILCPATLVDQWISEFKKLNWNGKICNTGNGQINIVSYESFRAKKIDFEYEGVILEGHKIKNKDAQITKDVKRINSKVRFVLTGTPIQNKLSELWSIFDFVNPNILGPYNAFREEFEENIQKTSTEDQKAVSYKYSVMLRSIIEPFILRRLKSQIQYMLPDKKDKVIFLQLSDMQKDLYIKTLESKRFEKLKTTMFRSKEGILGAISYLRKICNHPILVSYYSYDNFDTYKSVPADDNLMYEIGNNDYESYLSMLASSCKMQASFKLLDNWYSLGKKALLFFQTVQMLKVFEKTLKLFKPDFLYHSMTGSTPVKTRQHIIQDFITNQDIFVFLLTTKVGGFGLNLTGASRIIIFDPDWNPSTDNQAKERIYRFGQESEVEIYRFICKGTIEERVYEKQIFKDCLSRKILQNPDVSFRTKYFFDLFSYYNEVGTLTEEDENFRAGLNKNDEIVNIRQEDRRDFGIFKFLNSKLKLSGKELIEYIERRESCLKE